MPFFLDANVIIGFYFECCDKFGNSSTKVFANPNNKHSSRNIWILCFGPNDISGRCRTIQHDISFEFENARALLRTDYTVEELVGEIFDEEWKIKELIVELISQIGDDPADLKKHLKRIEHEFERDCIQRFQYLCDTSNLEIHTRDREYPEILIFLKETIDDEEDQIALHDAHHIGLIIQGLSFVTGDRVHILSKRDEIIGNTSLGSVISLSSF